MMFKYEIGDVVRLKSGGHRMVVTSIGDKYVRCSWVLKRPHEGSYLLHIEVQVQAVRKCWLGLF